MPPKAKFTKDEIIETALGIVKRKGFSALTARSLGEELGSSARPIFTVFQGMEEVQQEVRKAARSLYDNYIAKALSENRPYEQAFKSVGTQYILFACTEPKLFQLLFMEEKDHPPDFTGVLPLIDENYELILDSVRDGYHLDDRLALKLYKHLWVYTHGIASLCATGMCRFTEGEISEMVTDVFTALLAKFKA